MAIQWTGGGQQEQMGLWRESCGSLNGPEYGDFTLCSHAIGQKRITGHIKSKGKWEM
jgi:hypothetical protein